MNIKQVLVLCLLFAGIIARPVQSQTAPTPITCNSGNTLTAGTTYILSADCTGTGTFIGLSSGEATINGNGYSISGATGGTVIQITSGATLNLNNVTLSGSGSASGHVLLVAQGSTLRARNVIFSGNVGRALSVNDNNTTATLTNVQFLNNGPATDAAEQGYAVTVGGEITTILTINGATFLGNSGTSQVIRVNVGVLNLRGCIRVSGNIDAEGNSAAFYTSRPTGTINDDRGNCKKKKEKTPTPTATPQPPAATCIDLNQATGIVVSATYGLASGIQCQQLDGGGIGIPSIVNAGFIDAVDVWGYVVAGVEVCFPHVGRVIFLDAAASPRAMMPLEAWQDDGATCVSIDRPGSLVLLQPA